MRPSRVTGLTSPLVLVTLAACGGAEPLVIQRNEIDVEAVAVLPLLQG